MTDCGNVLVIGSEGVGKSTLIRAVLGSDATDVAKDPRGSLAVCESPSAPFRLIDAGNVGGSFFARREAIHAVKRWSKENALDGDANNDVHAIWFCVEGKSRKLIRQQVAHLSRATDVWRSVPIIVVITKSYAERERDENVALVQQTCARRQRLKRCLRAVIPVVASTYQLDDTSYVPATGISELIDATLQFMPEGVLAAKQDIAHFERMRQRAIARSVVLASSAAGVAIGAIPLPIADATILTPVETTMIGALAKLYGIGSNSASKAMIGTILEAGTVSTAAKAAISALKAVPGINLAASVLNAAIAGSIVAVMGEASMRLFERIQRGEKTIEDIAWAKQFMESQLSKELITKGTKLLGQVSGGSNREQRSSIVALLGSLAPSDGSTQEAAGDSLAKTSMMA